MMRYFLESWGYDVDLAENGQEALDKVDDHPARSRNARLERLR